MVACESMRASFKFIQVESISYLWLALVSKSTARLLLAWVPFFPEFLLGVFKFICTIYLIILHQLTLHFCLALRAIIRQYRIHSQLPRSTPLCSLSCRFRRRKFNFNLKSTQFHNRPKLSIIGRLRKLPDVVEGVRQRFETTACDCGRCPCSWDCRRPYRWAPCAVAE